MNKHSNARRLVMAGCAIALGVTTATPSGSLAAQSEPSQAQVTNGELLPFAAGASGSTSGHAQMVRTASGATIVSLHVTGLVPGRAYASHVHAAPCAVGAADGHYKHDPAGAATPPNEIWPGDGPFVAGPSGNANVNTVADFRAGATAVSVVVHDRSLPSAANKIACADLS